MLIVILFLVVVLVPIIVIYNNLIARKNGVQQAYGSIEVMLEKRYDLIPNLVDTVKQYMDYETRILEEVTKLRTKAVNQDLSPKEELKLNEQMEDKLQEIMVSVEDYPELKASEGFLNLQRSLNEVESQLAAARRTYNAAVTDYNNALEMFPSNIIANIMDYKRKKVFTARAKADEPIEINELFND